MTGTGRQQTTRAQRRRKRPVASPPKQQLFASDSVGDADGFWAVKDILDEKTERGRTSYLIQWAGIDPDTHGAWEPTWVCAVTAILL
jgi:hypothetical protein